jgi:6-phosphofructokinase 1
MADGRPAQLPAQILFHPADQAPRVLAQVELVAVLGRDDEPELALLALDRCGEFLALDVAVASGALAVLLPEREWDMQDIYNKIEEHEKSHYIVVVSEAYRMPSSDVMKLIEENTGMTARLTVLGHIQRGGAPSVLDRNNAARLGYRSVDLLRKGIGNRVVAIKSDLLTDYDIQEALDMKKTLDEEMYKISKIISM